MGRRLPTCVAILPELHALGVVLLVFRGGVVAAFANCASQRYHDSILFALSHYFLRLTFGLACQQGCRVLPAGVCGERAGGTIKIPT